MLVLPFSLRARKATTRAASKKPDRGSPIGAPRLLKRPKGKEAQWPISLVRRFGKNVWITLHARQSMQHRGIDDATLEQIVEAGDIKRKDDVHLWVYMLIDGRTDNMICAAAVESEALIIKTVMISWELEDEI